MAENLEDKIAARLEQLRTDIVANIESKRITASGRTQRSLQVRRYNSGVELVALAGDRAPLTTLEIGREGGRVPRGFTAILTQWSRDKGLSFYNERERRTFAYFLGRRIAKEGTLRARQHEDVYSTLTRKAAEDLAGLILASVQETIATNF